MRDRAPQSPLSGHPRTWHDQCSDPTIMLESESEKATVADVMRRHFVVASPELSLLDARQLMRLARMRHLVVTHNDSLIGLVSYRQLLESLLDDRGGEDTLSSAMVQSPAVVNPGTSLAEAADRLCRYGIGCLPVIDDDGQEPRIVGLITETDLLRAAFRR